MKNATIKEMVEKYLKEHGYDGLAGDECGCFIDDLFPCQCDSFTNCQAGYALELTEKNIGEYDLASEYSKVGDEIIVLEKPKVRKVGRKG